MCQGSAPIVSAMMRQHAHAAETRMALSSVTTLPLLLGPPNARAIICASRRRRFSASAPRTSVATLMSVKRRMIETSFSWKVSSRLRPRSLAALHADSASASERPSSTSRPLKGVTPMLIDRR